MRAKESVFVYRTASGLTRLFALALLALTVAAFFTWRAASADHTEPSDYNHWVFASEVGHDSDEAITPDLLGIPSFPGCEGVAGILFGTDPAWVRVGLSKNPNTPFVEARGQVLRPNPSDTDFANPRITWKDTTTNHWSMDINAYLTLDPDYRHLLGHDEFSGVLDIEWERGGIPMYAWPSAGDRMTVWGTHIWDCGHGDTYFGGDYFYHTEIHSPAGWVVYRNSADADNAPDSEEKRTRDWVWYGSGDLQGSAAVFPNAGTLETPIHATVADAFFSSFGGNLPESVNGCDTDPEIVGFTCTQGNEWFQNVLQQPYTFFVPAPARPAGNPVMIWASEDRCGDVPSNPANPPHDDPEDVGDASDDILSTADNIGAPTCGMSEAVTEGVDENGHAGIWVTVNGTPASYPANKYMVFAKRYKVGWDFIAPAAQSARQIHVEFDTLRVYDDGEPCYEDGEWLLALGANEGWVYPVRGSGDGGDPFWEFGSVDDGHVCIGDDDPFEDYSINAGVTIIAAHDQPIMFFSGGFETDILLTITNDIIPWLLEARDPGTYTSSLATGADGPTYRVIYTITDISSPPPTPGTLTIGDPKYGPNADTGGTATRVSKTTPIKLEGSDASALEYRYWKDGDPVPATWLFDTDGGDLLVDLTGATSDGRYTVEYAPVSQYSIVGERRTVSIELDSTPPVLTVPDDMVLDATSAAGRIVDYVATAEDELPGPVDFSCTPASGSFFPIKTVTTVTCTATDAVDNESTDSFTVEVVSPFGYIPDFVLLSHQWTNVGNNVVVQSGNVGAFDASTGVPSSSGFEVVIGPSAVLTGGPKVAGQSVRLQSYTSAGNVYSVDPVLVGSGVTYTAKSGYVPLFLGMPVVPAFSAGTKSKDFSGIGNVLAPGSYRNLKLAPNAVVTLTGGNYYFKSIEIGTNAQLLFAAAANVHVTGYVTAGNSAKLLPVGGSGIAAHEIVFWLTGSDGSSSAFQTSNDVEMKINVYARNGTVSIGPYNTATGAFLGLRVNVQNNTTLNLDSAFDYP